MKAPNVLLCILIIHQLSITNCSAQASEWTWMKGDSVPNSIGYFGLQGVPSPNNEPACRYACGYWTDTAGNFWIYSGVNAPGDLWKFDAATSMWTWMAGDSVDPTPYFQLSPADSLGVYDPRNAPGQLGYGMLTWATPDNHLWLYGGLMNTASGEEQGLQINDNLWQYDPATNEWAWMGTFGSGAENGPVYGTIGVGTTETMPGGRQEGNSTWVDSSGNLWLFGGCDVNLRSYNDLWEYNVATRIWTWVSGSDKTNDNGQYGTMGEAIPGRYPSARMTNFFWKDSAGNFWLSGGTNYYSDLFYQDTWMFNPQTLEWTWVNGPEGEDTSGSGINCALDSLNNFGAHFENRAIWKQCNDLIITYNGFNDWNTAGATAPSNNMWAYKISANEWVKINQWDAGGRYGTQGISSPANYPTSRFGGVGFIGRDGSLWMFGGQYDVTSPATVGYYFNDLWKYVFDTACVSCMRSCNVVPPVITMHDDTLLATGAVSYQWYFNSDTISNATSGECVPEEPGYYSVRITNAGGCTAISDTVMATVTGENNLERATVLIYPNPSSGTWQLAVTNDLIGSQLELYDEEDRLVYQSEIRSTKSEITANELPSGVYYLRIYSPNTSIMKKLVKL